MPKINSQKGAIEISTVAAIIIIAAIVGAVSVIATSKYYENLSISEPVAVITPKLTPNITSTPISEPTIEPTPSPSAEDIIMSEYSTKELLGENKDYSVYMLDLPEADYATKEGKIVVYDKNKKVAIPIAGLFSIFGATVVTDDGEGKYVALSNGTSTSRDIVILSLFEKKQIIDNFCSGSQIYFWEKYIIYESCDSLISRPWGDGEASSIKRTDLISKQVKVLFKADILHDFWINKIDGDTLFYTESSVTKEADWNSEENQKSTAKTFILSVF